MNDLKELDLQELFGDIHWDIFSEWNGIWNNHGIIIRKIGINSNQISMVGDYRDYIIRNLQTLLVIKNRDNLPSIDMQMSFSVLNKSYTVLVILTDLPPLIITHRDEVIEKIQTKREQKGKNRKNYGPKI